jgi:hypothetical protein
MANRHKFARGGRSGAESTAYSGGESNVAKDAKSTTDSFKKGGKVMGKKSKGRMDKFARGGRTGGSPFSSAKIKENTSAS